ncbi:MAG: zinc ribbon domain-containing protein [Proteobacteria bacterium]|nr:zinc ribbon domain-containing protein [Pseudomonadota bacterium]
MPIYEYRCGGCGHEFEEWQKIHDEPVKKCPSCRGRRVERLVSATSFQLKGGGWYVSEYGRGSGGPAKKSDSSSADSSGSDASSAETSSAAAPAKRSGAKEGTKTKASSAAGTSAS